MPDLDNAPLILTLISLGLGFASLIWSWRNDVSNKNSSKIEKTIKTIEKDLDSIYERDDIFLLADYQAKYQGMVEKHCLRQDLKSENAEKLVEKEMNDLKNDLPRKKQELAATLLQMYRAMSFFLKKNEIDKEMLAIVLHNKLGAHFVILDKAIFSEKILPSSEIEKDDVVSYLKDVLFVIGELKSANFFTSLMINKLDAFKVKVEGYLNRAK